MSRGKEPCADVAAARPAAGEAGQRQPDPRVLVVGASFTGSSATGMYLRTLFSGWPAERLAVADRVCGPLDWSRSRTVYALGDEEFRPAAVARAIRPWPSGPVTPEGAGASGGGTTEARRQAHRSSALRSVCARLYRWANGPSLSLRVAPSARLLSWVGEFRPDVLYGHCSDLPSVRMLASLHRHLGVPLVLHVMDDWAATAYAAGPLARRLRAAFQREFGDLLRAADVVLCICDEMAEEYAARYGRRCGSFYSPVDLDRYRAAARSHWGIGGTFRIRYGGRIGWSIRQSVLQVAAAVDSLVGSGRDVAFDIHTYDPEQIRAACRALRGVSVNGMQELSELPAALACADLLLIPYDFDPASVRMARYSMPGKLPECMASGTPILVYGPESLPVVRYARAEGWGLCVTEPSVGAVERALGLLMEDEALRTRLGQTAVRLAAERHDAAQVTRRFAGILAAATAEGRPGPAAMAASGSGQPCA